MNACKLQSFKKIILGNKLFKIIQKIALSSISSEKITLYT